MVPISFIHVKGEMTGIQITVVIALIKLKWILNQNILGYLESILLEVCKIKWWYTFKASQSFNIFWIDINFIYYKTSITIWYIRTIEL